MTLENTNDLAPQYASRRALVEIRGLSPVDGHAEFLADFSGVIGGFPGSDRLPTSVPTPVGQVFFLGTLG
ncbi:hypothetical protein BH11ARM1_BH11ARM1_07050 [soil metagenome]